MKDQDREYMIMAIGEARKSVDEQDGRVHPRVGVVVVKDNEVLGVAHRGETGSGHHAEFAVLEEKLADAPLAGSTVYTTLEPCTKRSPSKVPCAERLAERRVARVVIGMLDPNPDVRGKGQIALRDAGIDVDTFDHDLMSEVEELNREFRRSCGRAPEAGRRHEEYQQGLLMASREMELDDWYNSLNRTYYNVNYHRDPESLFTHLVEVMGGLSMLGSEKRKPSLDPKDYVPKTLAWWMTLCGKVGVKSVSEMVWRKFPYVCAYCHECPHNDDKCIEKKERGVGIDWRALKTKARANNDQRPTSLGSWQRMFSEVYPVQQTEAAAPVFARLMEELGELAEALRVFKYKPGYFLSEAADTFAWLMHIQNLVDTRNRASGTDRGKALEEALWDMYPDRCTACGEDICRCPPILASTIGRIAHEVPEDWGSFDAGGSFMTSDEARAWFQPKAPPVV